ncbi:winged helix-turn-helix transcriptional regulator [Lactiplantibacillus nangangensis]|uniref:Winged helix-turn-helix transcriptional regulator n=1 Tax=Lactiplantibacillus nangangensis TaxID=2559917 RepID=A0ABW1SK34_9LACO|nr:helix-turn-helix domain-containing protein [Lactiplantibacillus nangangensis]
MTRYRYDCAEGCPIVSTLQLISGKWKAVLIYQLFQHDTCRFRDFQQLYPNLSTRMLALQLKELEQDHLITKRVYPVMPPKTDYRLTDYGRTLQPLIHEMAKWEQQYNRIATDQPNG